jgi:hypothetical protein
LFVGKCIHTHTHTHTHTHQERIIKLALFTKDYGLEFLKYSAYQEKSLRKIIS